MKFSVLIFGLCLFAGIATAFGQITVVSTAPADNAVNVSRTTSIVITFSEAVDTTNSFRDDRGFMSNIDTMKSEAWSADLKTLTIQTGLKSNTSYFLLLWSIHAKGGSILATPLVHRFSTGASFPTVTVSGSVISGSTGLSAAHAIVGLSITPLGGSPQMVAGSFTDDSGNFTIPYVPNGTYYPLSAQDVNKDGNIDPSSGDGIATAPALTVAGSNLNGVNLTFQIFPPVTFSRAVDSLATVTGMYAGKSLRLVHSSRLDSTGASSSWEFAYIGSSLAESGTVEVEMTGSPQWRTLEENYYNWIVGRREITSHPPRWVVDSVIARTERNGGKAFRNIHFADTLTFDLQIEGGDVYNDFQDLISNPQLDYWGVTYAFGIQANNNWTPVHMKRFLADFMTGAILGTTGVPSSSISHPAEFSLKQNYPNPFNPATTLTFTIAQSGHTTLVVYNLLGQEVARVYEGQAVAGQSYQMSFDGSRLASGVYFARLESGSQVQMKKMTLLK